MLLGTVALVMTLLGTGRNLVVVPPGTGRVMVLVVADVVGNG